MKPRVGLMMALFLLVGVINSRAVFHFMENGKPLRWDLVAPETHLDLIPMISTNVVNPKTKAIRYFLASDAFSATNATAELNAVRAAFDQWQAIPGTIIKFEPGGLVAPGVQVNTADNSNVVYWAKTSTMVNDVDNIYGALAYTYTAYFDDLMAEADIVLNGVQYRWYAKPDQATDGSYSIEGIVLHEIGHLLGLEHSPVGGATMFSRGDSGESVQAGLSSEEMSEMRWLYPRTDMLAQLGAIRGNVTLNGSGILGAVVLVETMTGNIAASTVSTGDGHYEVPGLVPGNYQVRVTPLDPIIRRLVSGWDISPDYASSETWFLPTDSRSVVVAPNTAATLDFRVTDGNPAFRVNGIRYVTGDPGYIDPMNSPTSIQVGQSNCWVGIYSSDLPATGVSFRITGDGLTLGTRVAGSGQFIVCFPISVSSNATPGLRSFVIQQGTNIAYGNGFLEIAPAAPDFNFDGLDDRFQRRYFPLFTAPEAAPGADPDGDGFSNLEEYLSGTSPTNVKSFPVPVLHLVIYTQMGASISWQALAGRSYQVLGQTELAANPWQSLGPAIVASSNLVQFLDTATTNRQRFYRVRDLGK